MENIYFKGLEKALNEGAYIKVFNCSLRYPVARVEKKKDDKVELISYAENGNVIAVLNQASSNIISEIEGKGVVSCDNIALDNVLYQGYTLHFFKLSNDKVLSMVCSFGIDNYIPIKSIISDSIEDGFETLNCIFNELNIDKEGYLEFEKTINKQTNNVEKIQKILKLERKEKTNN